MFFLFVEFGVVIFIGVMIENFLFELNKVFLFCVCVYVLKIFEYEVLFELIDRVLSDIEKGLGDRVFGIEEVVRNVFIDLSGGDVCCFFIYLEFVVDFIGVNEIIVSDVDYVVGEKVVSYDNKGDIFYDLIFVFYKFVRGLDLDVVFYWYVRIFDGGGDVLYVGRCLFVIVFEDIGNVDLRVM